MGEKNTGYGEENAAEGRAEGLRLERLLDFDRIVIQAHNNPDADAIASGYGILAYLKAHGYRQGKAGEGQKTVRFVYEDGGIRKPNLVLLAEYLGDPIEQTSHIGKADLLLYVDCQPGERNVGRFVEEQEENRVFQRAVIDHHQVREAGRLPSLQRLCNYGSCATLVWQMLREAGYDVDEDEKLSTALYYGLFTDTNKLEEIFHPCDKDMRDQLKFNTGTITFFRNSNLSVRDLEIVSETLRNYQSREGYDYNSEYKFAVLAAEDCDDQNVLGIISDMLIEVHGIDVCAVYLVYDNYAQLSVRSCIRETRANELARYLTINEKNGGGHLLKAGGRLFKEYVEKAGNSFDAQGIRECLYSRMAEYFGEEDVFYAIFDPGNPLFSRQSYPDLSQGVRFLKKAGEKRGVVRAGDILFGQQGNRESRHATEEKEVVVRMMEGDFVVDLDKGDYIMLGVDEVYPIKKEDFDDKYTATEEPYRMELEYLPTVRSALTGESVLLFPYAKVCIARAEASRVYGQRLKRRTKLFTEWGDSYMLGEKGDWLVGAPKEEEDGGLSWDMWIVRDESMMENYEVIIELEMSIAPDSFLCYNGANVLSENDIN